LIDRKSGRELVSAGQGYSLGQTVYHSGKRHGWTHLGTEVTAIGPVLARLRIRGRIDQIDATTQITAYAELDRLDFDVRVHKPVSMREERLCQAFPILGDAATLRIATPGAVIRPRLQPHGDLLPGADLRRFAVQDFWCVSTEDAAVTVSPLDAFAMRLDLGPVCIEALGNDQNYPEVTKDQDAVTEFRFRYSLRSRQGGFDFADSLAFGRNVGTPLQMAKGRFDASQIPTLVVDPSRAIATCLKPADDPASGGWILRLWETAGRETPIPVKLGRFTRAIQTDLLERDGKPLPITNGVIHVPTKPNGFAAVRLS
jgi:alpha-mannosidase